MNWTVTLTHFHRPASPRLRYPHRSEMSSAASALLLPRLPWCQGRRRAARSAHSQPLRRWPTSPAVTGRLCCTAAVCSPGSNQSSKDHLQAAHTDACLPFPPAQGRYGIHADPAAELETELLDTLHVNFMNISFVRLESKNVGLTCTYCS